MQIDRWTDGEQNPFMMSSVRRSRTVLSTDQIGINELWFYNPSLRGMTNFIEYSRTPTDCINLSCWKAIKCKFGGYALEKPANALQDFNTIVQRQDSPPITHKSLFLNTRFRYQSSFQYEYLIGKGYYIFQRLNINGAGHLGWAGLLIWPVNSVYCPV